MKHFFNYLIQTIPKQKMNIQWVFELMLPSVVENMELDDGSEPLTGNLSHRFRPDLILILKGC